MSKSSTPVTAEQKEAGKAVCVWLKADTIKRVRHLADELFEGNFSMAARVAIQRGSKDLPKND